VSGQLSIPEFLHVLTHDRQCQQAVNVHRDCECRSLGTFILGHTQMHIEWVVYVVHCHNNAFGVLSLSPGSVWIVFQCHVY
jgi:hypothetical protein